jgi:TetR/AcrR family transcriptional regulator, tetracycline repressor protein
MLLHHFTIGFCIEEQAVAQALAAGDERYVPGRRAEIIGPENAPLTAGAGRVIFEDPGTRFAELTGLLLDTIARLRSAK